MPPHPAQVPCEDSEQAEPMDLETAMFLFLLQEKGCALTPPQPSPQPGPRQAEHSDCLHVEGELFP